MRKVEVDVKILRETDMAYFVSDGDNTSWIPKSQIDYEGEIKVGVTTTIEMPEWLALKSNLI